MLLVSNLIQNIRLMNLKGNILILAGGKRPTGQTAPVKEVVLRKIDLHFFSASDKH